MENVFDNTAQNTNAGQFMDFMNGAGQPATDATSLANSLTPAPGQVAPDTLFMNHLNATDMKNMNWNATGGIAPSTHKKFTDSVVVIGYIAPRYNVLKPTIPSKDLKEAVKKVVDQLVASNSATTAPGKKLDKTGALVASGKDVTIDATRPNISALLTFDFEAYKELRDRNNYVVQMNELRAQFYVLRDLEAEAFMKTPNAEVALVSENSSVNDDMQSYSSAVSEDRTTAIVAPKRLAELQVTQEAARMKVVDINMPNRPTRVMITPDLRKVTRNGKTKIQYGHIFWDAINQKALKNLGSIGIPYFVNRDFRGKKPAQVGDVTNAKTYNALFPNVPVSNLSETAGQVPAKEQLVPFSEIKDKAALMGVTASMVEKIRTTGGSNSKKSSLTPQEINDTFQKSVQIFRSVRNNG